MRYMGKRTLIYCWWELVLLQSLWKPIQKFLKWQQTIILQIKKRMIVQIKWNFKLSKNKACTVSSQSSVSELSLLASCLASALTGTSHCRKGKVSIFLLLFQRFPELPVTRLLSLAFTHPAKSSCTKLWQPGLGGMQEAASRLHFLVHPWPLG